MRLKYFFILHLAACTLAATPEDEKCPINIPGYTHRGDCNLLCKEATWTDITVFYLGNYVAHAVTVNTDPGQPILSSVLAVILVILFPGTGIEKALLAIYSRAVLALTELQQAARAGALCVVRKRDTSAASSVANSTSTTEEEEQAMKPTKNPISLVSEKLHGICELPEGYYLATLPQDATFEDDPSPGELQSLHWTERGLVGSIKSLFMPRPRRNHISCSYNLVKIAASAAQLLFACATLYRIRGDQIERFGYAAFRLTVAQCAWMSFLNLLGNAVRPGYPTKFLVGSDSLDNLRALLRRKCQESESPISGSVGRISQETEARLSAMQKDSRQRRMSSLVSKLVRLVYGGTINSIPEYGQLSTLGPDLPIIGAVPIAIIGGISRFSPGASEYYQRVWIMTWFVFGIVAGPLAASFLGAIANREWQGIFRNEARRDPSFVAMEMLIYMIWLVAYATPAIGGLLVVGQMIREYGVCTEL
ncbi:hypothetical protein QBC37DRAFT_292336 [Rhypophila decipiens]|uniref:Uncharacterized protein n=1 Tax=Rhypophila decipiens TaxID=261697 RepID=A0AAN7B592_9PEZI|nr:hypothetical protein QBC37DRAFT_292336 [Rhypophila decipiens]